ncbi:unnamed protein product, partial [Vitis vinifera]
MWPGESQLEGGQPFQLAVPMANNKGLSSPSQPQIELVVDVSIVATPSDQQGLQGIVERLISPILTRFHAGYFRISLSLCSQALLWKTLGEPSDDAHAIRHILHTLPSTAFVLLWSLALFILASLSLIYILRCLFHFELVKAEFLNDPAISDWEPGWCMGCISNGMERECILFLFFAAPSMASLAWDSIIGTFDNSSKMLFFLSLFLFMSLVSRPGLFKKSIRKFDVAWWAYSFPLTVLALAATEYAQEVNGGVAHALMLVLSILSVLVSLLLMVFTALNTNMLVTGKDDPALNDPNDGCTTLP